MSFSSPSDKRDLLLVFGLDRKIQEKDSFFHNANSIIKEVSGKSIPFLREQQILKIDYGRNKF